MPARDRHHVAVVNAFVKDGWTITNDQFTIVLPERFLWIDLRAEKEPGRSAILVEVKGFGEASAIDALASAIGKYVLYLAALEITGNDTPLHLAVPIAAMEGILSETIGKQLIRRLGVRLVTFDPDQERIVEWIA